MPYQPPQGSRIAQIEDCVQATLAVCPDSVADLLESLSRLAEGARAEIIRSEGEAGEPVSLVTAFQAALLNEARPGLIGSQMFCVVYGLMAGIKQVLPEIPFFAD